MACNLTEGRTVQDLDMKWDNQAFRPSLGVISILPNILLDQPTGGDSELRWDACGTPPWHSVQNMQSGSLDSV